MKNAHERFGELVYIRRSEKTRTHIRVHLSAWLGEESKAHLVSVIAGDTEIGALSAAFASHDAFTVINPDGSEKIVSLGESPTCFRGAINIAGRKRPLKHHNLHAHLRSGLRRAVLHPGRHPLTAVDIPGTPGLCDRRPASPKRREMLAGSSADTSVEFPVLGLAVPNPGLDPASRKDGLGERASEGPESCRSGEQTRQRGAGKSSVRRQ